MKHPSVQRQLPQSEPWHTLSRRAVLAIPLGAAAVSVVGCHTGGSTASPTAGGGTFREAHLPVDHLNPAFGGGGSPQSTLMEAMMWEGLVRRDPTNSRNYLPGAAEKWDISSDGLTFTFHLRDGLKWSNGEALTADDWVWSYSYYYSPSLSKQGNKNSVSHSVDDSTPQIKGLADYFAGKTTDFSTVGIQATDKRTLVFTLLAPSYRMLDTLVGAYPLHKKSVEANKNDFWLPAHFVGNGPYALTKYTQNSSATLKLNEKYWDAKSYGIKTRTIQFNAAGTTGMMLSYNAGEIDLFRVDGDPTALIAGRSDLKQQLKHGTFVQFKGLNVLPNANPILQKNIKLRQALALALDRNALAQVSPPDVAGPSFVPSGIAGADKLPKIPFDPAKAKQLLSEAGFANGKGVPTLQILTYASMPVLEAVASMWKTHLNISAKVSVQEPGVYTDMEDGNLPANFVGFAFTYQAPSPFMMMTYGGKPDSYGGNATPYPIFKKIYDLQNGKDKNKYPAAEAAQMVQKLYQDNYIPEYKNFNELAAKAAAAQGNLDNASQLATEAAIAWQNTYLQIPLLWSGYAFMEKPRVHNLVLTSYYDDMFTLKGVTVGPTKS